MDRLRPYFDELTRALLVLALILFNLAHQPTPTVAYDGFSFISAASVYCGSPSSDDQLGHSPCHACRIGGDAVLPPPPCDAVPVSLDAVVVLYGAVPQSPKGDFHVLANRSRGPPLLA